MPTASDGNWGGLGLGRQPAHGPTAPDDLDVYPFLDRIQAALSSMGPPFAERAAAYTQRQLERARAGEGPLKPDDPELAEAFDIAGAFGPSDLGSLGAVTKIVKSNPGRYDALDDVTKVGSFILANDFEKGEKFPFMEIASVNPEFRRQGIARSAYDFIESDIGRRLFPSPLGLSEEATNLWKKRLSDLSASEVDELLAESRRTGLGYGIPSEHIDERLAPFAALGLGRKP